jgi:hypothetical protein
MSDKPYRKGARKMRGKPFDEFHCFFIKDFQKGDSIRVSVKSRDKRFVKGVVTDIDLVDCLIHYKTADRDDNVTVINHIVSLEAFKQDFLKS